MIVVTDINYVAFMSVVEKIDFDVINKVNIPNKNGVQTQFIYNEMDNKEYLEHIADYNKSYLCSFMSKLRELKNIVHL